MAINNNVKRTNPNAAVFIYNYRDRFGDVNLKSFQPFEVDQIILNSTSLISVSTSKDKSKPAGSFEIKLAPTKNWVTAITPGSWCIILMSNSELDDKAKYGGGQVDEKSFKMLGRIESVRGVIEVDQATGARNTGYLVQGVDWGTIFDSTLYVDPLNRASNDTALGMAERFGFDEYIAKAVGYEPWTKGNKANEDSPATIKPKTEESKKSADRTSDFIKNGIATMMDGSTKILPTIAAGNSAADTAKDFLDGIVEGSKPEPRFTPAEQPAAAEQFTTEAPTEEESKKIQEARATEAAEEKAEAEAEVAKKKEDAKTGTLAIGTKLPTAADAVEAILKLWGRSDPATSAMGDATGLLGKSQQQFRIPERASQYMNFRDRGGKDKSGKATPPKRSNVISQILHQITGKLIGYDKYSNVDKSAGIIDFNTILGEHSVWQVLNDNNNSGINELIPEIRFENGNAKLTLYNRVRPFALKSEVQITADRAVVGDGGVKFTGPLQKDEQRHQDARKSLANFYFSKFERVRTKNIDLNDIITCNFGTNWRDKYNFIEVNIDRSLFVETYDSDIKLQSQFRDEESIGRDGLQSMMASFQYIPVGDDGIQSALDTFVYKYALKEWYFNTHKMLNGNLQLIGQDQYIQVGDNIRVKAEALGLAKNISAAQKKDRSFSYLTAHVESISHTAQIDPNGARSFTTSINFTRGVITDVRGKLIAFPGTAGAVDQDAAKVTPSVEKNTGVFGTSSGRDGESDPDHQKLKGK